MVFVRTPQIRWTFLDQRRLDRRGRARASQRRYRSRQYPPDRRGLAANIQGDEELPDLTAAVRYGGDWGHVRLAGILRKIGYDTRGTDDNEPDGSETGWGINATTAIKLGLATPRLGVVYGRGIATYMNDGGMDLAPSVSTIFEPPSVILVPEAEAVKLLGVSAYVDLQWAKQWSSAIGYSFTKVDNTNFQDADRLPQGRICLGQPALHAGRQCPGRRSNCCGASRTDNDGEKGTDLRLQASFKWSFSSKNIWDWFE